MTTTLHFKPTYNDLHSYGYGKEKEVDGFLGFYTPKPQYDY